MDILSVLKQEHRTVSTLLDEVKGCEPDDDRIDELAKSIENALTVHATLEERLFYPKLRDRAEEADERVDVFEAYTEHDVVKHLLSLLNSGRKRDEQFKAELLVLGESVKHHVQEEESTIFSMARELLDEDELEEIGESWARARQRLDSRASTNGRRGGPRKKASSGRSKAGARKKTASRKR
ncbi:MAG: hemerythrin domain-containing protein [Candidatus Eremiobacteraeota bacterium]|nr:hemerythrin domain-containing protein [Candidatus Eremiobacteraeota bacterium]